MTNSAARPRRALPTVETTARGWFPIGPAGEVAAWDGAAWTGERRADPAVSLVPAPHRPARERAWILLLLAGLVVTAAGGFLGRGGGPAYLVLVLPGLLLTGAAVVELFRPRLQFQTLPRPVLLLVVGLGSGVVALLIASTIEGRLWPALGFSFGVDLWLSGVVEETCKLLVPVVLWIAAGGLFRDPRTGMLLALLSGTAFGVGEGILYIGNADGDLRLLMALGRPLAEAGHPIWTAIAAALIWLAAHRAGRLVTVAGAVGWLIAAGSHSLHDGLGSAGAGRSTDAPKVTVSGLSQVLTDAALENLLSAAWLVFGYLVLRHVARELTPPSAIAGNPVRWRPRVKLWGLPRDRGALVGAGGQTT